MRNDNILFISFFHYFIFFYCHSYSHENWLKILTCLKPLKYIFLTHSNKQFFLLVNSIFSVDHFNKNKIYNKGKCTL